MGGGSQTWSYRILKRTVLVEQAFMAHRRREKQVKQKKQMQDFWKVICPECEKIHWKVPGGFRYFRCKGKKCGFVAPIRDGRFIKRG